VPGFAVPGHEHVKLWRAVWDVRVVPHVGQELRKLYDPPMKLPPHLLVLARELGTREISPLAEELPTTLHALVRKLEATSC
jgi:hypothetical protein